MKLFSLILITIICAGSALFADASADNTKTTQGVKRYAVIAGSNSGGNDRITLSYADNDAQAFSDVFTSLGGLNKQDRQLLLEPTPKQLLDSIEQVKQKIKLDQANFHSNLHVNSQDKNKTTKQSAPQPRVEFIFYYSGHSDEKNLLLGEQTLAYSTLRDSLNEVDADVRLAILDSCASGAFTRLKGGQQVTPFLENDSNKLEGYAYLASSSADESAQESDAIGGAYFTHYLVSALRGAADISKDKKVTLDEAYQYAFNETLARTQGSVYGAQHAAYDIQLSGESSLVLTHLEKTSAFLVIDDSVIGRVYIRDQNGLLKVELNKLNLEPLNIGLEAGEYQITIEQDGKIFQAKKFAINKGVTLLKSDLLTEIDPTYSVARGSIKESDIEEIGFKFSVIPSMEYPENLNNKKQRVKIDVNLFGNDTYQINGIALGNIYNNIEDSTNGVLMAGVFNINQGDFKGWSLSGVANFHTGQVNDGNMFTGVLNYSQNNFKGIMGSGLANVSQGETKGVLAAGGLNIITHKNAYFSNLAVDKTKTSKGILLAGALNFSEQDYTGWQISGASNINFGNVNGVQISGGVNIASNIKGSQFGVVNFAKEMDGYAFGLINFIGNGRFDLAVSYDELEFFNVGLKSGSKKSFSHIYLGKSQEEDLISFGLGWGLSHKLGDKITIENALYVTEYTQFNKCVTCEDENWIHFTKHNTSGKYQLNIGLEVAKQFKPYLGISYNQLIHTDDSTFTIFDKVLKNKITDNGWIGFNLGVDF